MSEQTSLKQQFVRATVTIPAELAPFAQQRASQPEHAGNLSSYIRGLIVRDKREAASAEKAEVVA